ncbi:hypothetical protein [Rhodanobacter sp. C01]|uniref:hypothetical protein n=1 Tax=Rhodanobacter sp. C01 TaxID=1945856 RepID=UPI0011159613|nr:hypothetical protein [Rhodanobacter sp. C01]
MRAENGVRAMADRCVHAMLEFALRADRKESEIYITRGRAEGCSRERADVVDPVTHPMEIVLMYNYPVLESLVAFAIVFLIGFLVANNSRRGDAVASKSGVART